MSKPSENQTNRSRETNECLGALILVVEDEPSVLTTTVLMLERKGCKTIVATDGAEAVSTYEQKKDEINIVLLDMMMPVMEGDKTIEALRKINPKVKILAVSGYAKEERYEKSIKDVQAFLMKPYTIEELMATIRKVLQHNN